jgi:hypothetical protein
MNQTKYYQVALVMLSLLPFSAQAGAYKMTFESDRNDDYFAIDSDNRVLVPGVDSNKVFNLTTQDGTIEGSYKNCYGSAHVHVNGGFFNPYGYGYDDAAGCDPVKKFSFNTKTGTLTYLEKNSFGFWQKSYSEQLKAVSADKFQGQQNYFANMNSTFDSCPKKGPNETIGRLIQEAPGAPIYFQTTDGRSNNVDMQQKISQLYVPISKDSQILPGFGKAGEYCDTGAFNQLISSIKNKNPVASSNKEKPFVSDHTESHATKKIEANAAE